LFVGLADFPVTTAMMNYEFQVHHVDTKWKCNLCSTVSDSQDILKHHLNSSHIQDLSALQVKEILSSCRRVVPRKSATETCSFCLTTSAQSQKGFANHVGRYQQEISLAALPTLDNTPDDRLSDDNDGGDDNESEDRPLIT
jgi:hypothetical protein